MTEEISLGGFKLDQPGAKEHRLSMLIWGTAGCGKTTLAATAPGKKLWISFDPDGTASIADRDDVVVLDLAKERDAVVEKFKDNDPLKISKFFEENDIDTVVVDSLTSFGDKALNHGVYKAQGTSKGKSATLEDPGYAGYGNKNTWMRLCVKNMLEITAKYNKHIIFIAHEDKPTTNDEGVVMHITINEGSSLNAQVPLQISEVWTLEDTGKKRRIAVRPCRSRKPMKTRMFKANGNNPEFDWNYDAETDEGEGIADWYGAWKKNNYSKMELPT